MQVRQAIVSSPRSRALKQNEMVSRSESISDELALALCQWSPGKSGFSYGCLQSVNFFQADADTFALSRSVGGLEFDREDGRCVVTKILLFDRKQLQGYHNNIGVLTHVVQSAGLLILQKLVSDKLPHLDVPDRAFETLCEFSRPEFEVGSEKVSHAVEFHSRVVVLGLKNPLSLIPSLFASLPVSKRLDYSFATGLKVEDERQFSIQFFPESEPDFVRELAGRQIRTLSFDAKPTKAYAY